MEVRVIKEVKGLKVGEFVETLWFDFRLGQVAIETIDGRRLGVPIDNLYYLKEENESKSN